MRQSLRAQRAYELRGELGLERRRPRGPVALVQRHREPSLPHLDTVAHGTQEGRVAAGALRQPLEPYKDRKSVV